MGESTTQGPLAPELPDQLSRDEIHAILASPVRRQLISILLRLETAERTPTLARNIALEMEDDDPASADRIHIRLYHVHIPKLEAAGVVTTDGGEGLVELTDAGEEVAGMIVE